MIADLRAILDGWEFEPGKISVRKIIGRDGHEKVQTRVDLGLLQFENEGRPDGRRPYGCTSMLEFFESRLREHIACHGSDEDFTLLPEDCRDLRHEAHLWYQRYLSLFVLEDYNGVVRDTDQNLRIIELCHDYAEEEGDGAALETHRPYVTMMKIRAEVYRELNRGCSGAALTRVNDGIQQLRQLAEQREQEEDSEYEGAPEIDVLDALRREVLDKMPAEAVPRLEVELSAALEREDYEAAAHLRDQIRQKSIAESSRKRTRRKTRS